MNLYLSEISLKNFCTNIFFLLRKNLKETIIEQRQADTYNQIMLASMASAEYAKKYKSEIERLQARGRFTFYPSQDIPEYDESAIQGGFDSAKGLAFVDHNGKKLYFPASYTVKQAKRAYYEMAVCDSILGTDAKGTPHQYQGKDYCLKEGDVLVDVGCAEALFALDNIEKASKVILIERNSSWLKALRATFQPYMHKVRLVNKLVSRNDSKSTITLQTLLAGESRPIFIKMDIEGYEVETIRSAQEFLTQKSDITLACCTYHTNNDAQQLETLFQAMGYSHEYSDGYMLFTRYDQPLFPYFRHGLIRAKK
ncbi:MAG: FkbM family methyltransferase [Bacteroidales bacterium]|nr:FkbM family methyltransferase [Bacteroidales bacterium]